MSVKLSSGHEVEELKGEELAEQQRDFKGYDFDLIRLHPGRYLLPKDFLRHAEGIYNFEFEPEDVLVMTYPKVGTTWTQEVVWTMRNNPDLNNPLADLAVNNRCPFMDSDMLFASPSMKKPGPDSKFVQELLKICPNLDFTKGAMLQLSAALPRPRTIKTHLPFSFFKKGLLDSAKVVYVYRNPKDTLVSWLHHQRLMKGHHYQNTDEKFVDYFVKGDLLYGCYSEHLKEAQELVGHPNLYILNYEEMKRNPLEEVQKLDKFMGTSLTEQQMKNVVKHTSFEEMKKRDNLMDGVKELDFFDQKVLDSDGGFFRAGKSGSYKTKLTGDLEKQVDKWTNEKCKGLDAFKFIYN